MFCSNNSGHGILELCKTILCETVGILARRGRQSSSEELSRPQDLRLLNSLSGRQVAFCGVIFVSFIFYALEILRLEICFAILIHRLEEEQNPCSAGGFMMVSLFQAFPSWMAGSYLGIPVNEPCPFQQLPRGWACVPRQGHLSGGPEGQRGCREALPTCRPREPGEDGWLPPQPRS